MDDGNDDFSDVEGDEEELDPRIQMELEKLNAATDGINHLETEFGEAQALFQQMMQDATFQLKSMHQKLGKSVDKSRPYYEALKQAKIGHNQLHQAALTFEQAQSRHYNAKKRVIESEKKAFSSENRRIDPALQEMLNQSTIEVMEAATSSQDAWERHREASVEFEEKQKTVQDSYRSLRKHIFKSRPYFDMKMGLNKQLEVQKQRLEKIQEGIQGSKNAYSETLHNLELISDDIHRSRELKKKAILEPRGQGVGADSDNEEVSINHCLTLERIRSMTLDNVSNATELSDSESTDSEASNDNILNSDITFENKSETSSNDSRHASSTSNESPHINIQLISNEENNNYNKSHSNSSLGCSNSVEQDCDTSLGAPAAVDLSSSDIEDDIKEFSNKVDSSYDVITSHSIPFAPEAFDMLDGKKKATLLDILDSRRRSRSFTDMSRFDYLIDEGDESLKRRNSAPTHKRAFSFGNGASIKVLDTTDSKSQGTPDTSCINSPKGTPKTSIKNPFARFTSFSAQNDESKE